VTKIPVFFRRYFPYQHTHWNIQGDHKVSVHPTITVQKTQKSTVFQTVSITYHDNIVKIRDNRWCLCESSVPLALAVGCQAVRLSQVVRQERGVL
jgi:hypothetical protein